MLAHFMLLHGLFISNKNFTVLVTMKTVTKKTGYFALYSSIAILAECFVCFFGRISILTVIMGVYISRYLHQV